MVAGPFQGGVRACSPGRPPLAAGAI